MVPKKSDTTRDPEQELPLSPPVYHILLALAEHPCHGYAIMKEVEERSGGRVRLSTGTLYAAIKRLLNGDLISETDERPDPDDHDSRRRYYILTPFGRQVARAETHRMYELVGLAESRQLFAAPGTTGQAG